MYYLLLLLLCPFSRLFSLPTLRYHHKASPFSRKEKTLRTSLIPKARWERALASPYFISALSVGLPKERQRLRRKAQRPPQRRTHSPTASRSRSGRRRGRTQQLHSSQADAAAPSPPPPSPPRKKQDPRSRRRSMHLASSTARASDSASSSSPDGSPANKRSYYGGNHANGGATSGEEGTEGSSQPMPASCDLPHSPGDSLIEITTTPRSLTLNAPIILGFCILQNGKTQLLTFYKFLKKYLRFV